MTRLVLVSLLACFCLAAWSNPYEDEEAEEHGAVTQDFSRDVQAIPAPVQKIIRDLVVPSSASEEAIPSHYRTTLFRGKSLFELFQHMGELNAQESSLGKEWEAATADMIADMLKRGDDRSIAEAAKACAHQGEVKAPANATKLFCDRLTLAIDLQKSKGKPPAKFDKKLQVFYEQFSPAVRP